jgi:hypothetical protein
MAFLRIGDTCPNFDAKSQFGDFNLYEYLGEGWGIIFSHPADFTRESKTKKKKKSCFYPMKNESQLAPCSVPRLFFNFIFFFFLSFFLLLFLCPFLLDSHRSTAQWAHERS